MGWIRREAIGVAATDWAAVSLIPAVRLGVTICAVLGVALLFDRPDLCLGLGVGVLFTAVADPGGSARRRLYALTAGSALMIAAVLLGSLVADLPVLHLLLVAAWSLVAGFFCCTGPRGAILGVLTLVLVVVFSAMPPYPHDLVLNTVACAIGCGVMVIVICSPWVLKRAGGLRGQLALFYRGVASSIALGADAMRSPVHATRLRAVSLEFDLDMADASQDGPFAPWFADLLDESVRFRFSLMALSAHLLSAEPSAPLVSYVDATRELSRAIGLTLAWPLRRGRLSRSLDHFDRAHATCMEKDPTLAALVVATSEPLRQAAVRVSEGWPVGRGSGIHLPAPRRPAPLHLRSHMHWADPFLRHGVRLAIAMSIAVTIELLVPFSHDFWMAVTVAWIAKPGSGDTTAKVMSRVTGTVAGIVVAVGLDLVLPMHNWDMAVVIAISAAFVLAFMIPNYAIYIAALTVFVFLLTSLQVNNILAESPYRLLATVIGGLIVLVVAQLWPVTLRGSVCSSLIAFASAIEAYGTTLLGPDGFTSERLPELHADLLRARTASHTLVTSAAHEPGRRLLHVADGTRIVTELDRLSADLLKWETLGRSPLWQEAADNLTSDLEVVMDQLRQLEASGRVDRVRIGEMTPNNGPGFEHIIEVATILNNYA